MEFPLDNGISAAVQGRKSLQGRRSNGDVQNSKRRQSDSLLRAFDEDDLEDDLELGLTRLSEEGEGEGDSIETLPENHSPKSPTGRR